MKKRKIAFIVLGVFGSLIALALTFVGGFLIFASITTLNPADHEVVEVKGTVTAKIDKNQELKLLTWNTGYCGLDEREDCYFDGGNHVIAESKETVIENMEAMKTKIAEINPDIFLLQEVDLDSKRSYNVQELNGFKESFKEDSYQNTYACNFRAGFVPLPLYEPLGHVDAGIATFSKYQVTSASREQLPIPFSWPMSLMNLKRCLLVDRIAIADSEKELVLINLHLEAYDDGEGKAKQLKQMMDLMQSEYDKGNYVIAGGDFNQTFSNTNYQKYPKLNDWVCPVIDVDNYPSFTFKMDDTYPTCRSLNIPYYNADKANHQYYMIDGFIVSNNITINEFETLNLEFKNTDHNPVRMNVTLN